MGQLIYSMIMSVDGLVTDREGNFEWATPNEFRGLRHTLVCEGQDRLLEHAARHTHRAQSH